MRTVRWMSSVLALVALTPVVSAAQSNRLFENAWFWGAKAGLMNFSTGNNNTTTAPLVGAEWLITRNRAGLYLSAEQAFFNTTGYVFDSNGQPYNVALKDSRRYTAALLAFPVNWGSLRPYGGVGLSLNPATPVTSVKDVMHLVDLLQIMTVDPGFAGQAFLTRSNERVAIPR